jgi:hypothetical protein
MRYAENWTKIDINQLNLENVLAWALIALKANNSSRATLLNLIKGVGGIKI